MGYMHIENLYKNQNVMLFKEVFAMEKIHGTSAHLRYADGGLTLNPGERRYRDRFVALFDQDRLKATFATLGQSPIIIYGEAYGGCVLKQAWRYGEALRFVAFEVRIGDLWLAVPAAGEVARTLGLDFVDYKLVPATLEALDIERMRPSTQSSRNGMGEGQPREGIVIRPPIEVTLNNGHRIIAKHKNDVERETTTPRRVADPAQLEVLQKADAIAAEWVTPMRLGHVLQKILEPHTVAKTGQIITAMCEDVCREAAGEIVDGREARAAIGRATVALYKQHMKACASGN